MQGSKWSVAVTVSGVACLLAVATFVWALVRNGAPDIAPHEFVVWGAMVVLSGVTSTYAASRFRTPHWWSGVVKLRRYKLNGKGQIGLDVLTWWLAMGGLPGSLVVQLAINKQRGLPVGFLLLTLWTAVCATVWVIAWMEPNRLTAP
jgi:hypothetical protein